MNWFVGSLVKHGVNVNLPRFDSLQLPPSIRFLLLQFVEANSAGAHLFLGVLLHLLVQSWYRHVFCCVLQLLVQSAQFIAKPAKRSEETAEALLLLRYCIDSLC